MESLRPMGLDDFRASLRTNAPSVSRQTIEEFDEWRRSKGQAWYTIISRVEKEIKSLEKLCLW